MVKHTSIIFGLPMETFASHRGTRRNKGEMPSAMFKGVWSFSGEKEKPSPTSILL
jgi:hypothetical protein